MVVFLPASVRADEAAEEATGYLRRCRALADRLEQAGHPRAAAQVRAHTFPRDPHRQYVFFVGGRTRLKADREGDVAELRKLEETWWELRRDQAKRLVRQAGQCVVSDPGRAYRLLFEALYEDPANEDARRLLALPRRSSRSGTLRTVRPQKAHPWFGWSPRQYWIVRSPHFEIVTRVRGSAPRQLAGRLEQLLLVWCQLFFECWTDGRWLRERWRGGGAIPEMSERFRVVLFRDRDDYVRSLASEEPQIGQSLGYYVPSRRASFFYSERERPWSTWHHEVTHQLFHEISGGVDDPGERAQIWAVEGVALYMESLRVFDGYATVGGFDAERLQFARYRRLRSGYFVPLEEMAALGREDFQRRSDVRKLYSQSAGVVHYLMDGDAGALRPGFVRFLDGVYQGRESIERLVSATGRSLEELSRGYAEYLIVTDDDLPYVGPSEQVRQLCLGKTRVTADGMVHLRNLRHLEWLDVAGLPVGSDDLEWVGQNRSLTQLMAERTLVDDRFGKTISELSRLAELDLSGTRIGDGALESIAQLSKLESLWISDTNVTDASVHFLSRLRRLELLDVSNTKMTRAGVEKLRRALPKLKELEGP